MPRLVREFGRAVKREYNGRLPKSIGNRPAVIIRERRNALRRQRSAPYRPSCITADASPSTTFVMRT
jgi:hypothetical protein